MAALAEILFVDPTRVLHKMVDRICRDHEVGCRHASNTIEALTMIAERRPTAVVAGLEQRDFSAISLVAALKSDNRLACIPIAVLTTECRIALPGVYQPDRVLCRDSSWRRHLTEFLRPVFEEPRAEAAEPTKKPRVLLVDDSATMQRLAAHILHIGGCEVTIVENGRLALDTLSEDAFDLAFMDIEMPVMDGRETIRRIRAGGSSMPVFALTAHDPEQFTPEAIGLGFDGVCPKPIRRDPL
ncbi:MAG: response regulator, partial [Planctomycetes bacterium]|nr:response regulator [Planctomycetota bacterium]